MAHPAGGGGQAAGRNMRKFRFLRQSFHPPHEKLKQELFAFPTPRSMASPTSPASALAFDPELRVMACCTRSGAVKIYGAPWCGVHTPAPRHGHHHPDAPPARPGPPPDPAG